MVSKLLAKSLVDGQGKGFLQRFELTEDLDEVDVMPYIQASCEAVKCPECMGLGYIPIYTQLGGSAKDCSCRGTGAVIRKREGR